MEGIVTYIISAILIIAILLAVLLFLMWIFSPIFYCIIALMQFIPYIVKIIYCKINSKTKYFNRLIENAAFISSNYHNACLIDAENFYEEHSVNINNSLKALQELHDNNNIEYLLKVEKTIKLAEKNSIPLEKKKAHRKIDILIQNIENMIFSISFVNYSTYVMQTESFEKRYREMPCDFFHQAAKNYIKYLEKQINLENLPDFLFNEYTLRLKNIKLAQDLYYNMQLEAFSKNALKNKSPYIEYSS